MLLDSNIMIDAALHQDGAERDLIEKYEPKVSAVSLIEVLGFHEFSGDERQVLESLFERVEVVSISDTIVKRAVKLRQQHPMSVGDSIIAATALCHRLTLVTRDVDDFAWIHGLAILSEL